MAEIGVKGEAHLLHRGRPGERECEDLRLRQRRGDPAVGSLADGAGIAVDDVDGFAAGCLTGGRDRGAARQIGLVGVAVAGYVAVIFQKELLQLADVPFADLARIAASAAAVPEAWPPTAQVPMTRQEENAILEVLMSRPASIRFLTLRL